MMRGEGLTHLILSFETSINKWEETGWAHHVLVETLYRTQHFNVTACRSHEVDNDACARVT